MHNVAMNMRALKTLSTVAPRRRPRLSVVQQLQPSASQRFKDHITGEELNVNKMMQRVNEGFYSAYQIRHLNLELGRRAAG